MMLERGIYPSDDPRDFDNYFLYVFRCGPYHKVGITTDLEKRKRGIETTNPFTVKRLLFRRFQRKHIRWVEKFVHTHLAEYRHRGEWFTAPFPVIKEAIRLAAKALPQWDAEYEEFVQRSMARERKARAKYQDSIVVDANPLAE